MTSVGFYSNSLYPNYGITQLYQTSSVSPMYKYGAANKLSSNIFDAFVKRTAEEKLDNLFPNNELTKIFYEINKDFGIDLPAKLNFVTNKENNVGGGYTFSKNEINMNISDLVNSDTKIVGIKNGQMVTLLSETERLPLFIDRKTAEDFVKSQENNLGFDQLIAVPVTKDEHRKFIIQKLTHEIIHAQQHMIMRNDKNIGSHEIIKAWNNQNSDNFLGQIYSSIKSYIDYKFSVWNDIKKEINELDSKINESVAHSWLDAVKNYPPVNTQEYLINKLEADANTRAAKYVENKYGAWN